jgi:heme exporter protein D
LLQTVVAVGDQLAATGVDSAWLIWPALAIVVLGIVAVVVTAVVRRRRHSSE